MTTLQPFLASAVASSAPRLARHSESSPDGSPADHVPERPSGEASARPTLGVRRELIALALTLVAWVVSAGLVLGGTALGLIAQDHMRPKPDAPLAILTRAAAPTLDASTYLAGRALFAGTCALCHGPTGLGVQGLGKDLVTSPYIAEMPDAGLAAFITAGRAATDPYNTTRLPMPPRGGNPQLTQADLAAIVVFLRGLQDPRRVPADALHAPVTPPAPPPPPSADEKAAALVAAGGDAELAGYIANGNRIFHAGCIACHGKGGVGMPGNGKTLVKNEFIRSLDDDGLLAFLKRGRAPSDPKNSTGIQMPPKGGNPALSDDDLLDVIAYLRTLQEKSSPAASSK